MQGFYPGELGQAPDVFARHDGVVVTGTGDSISESSLPAADPVDSIADYCRQSCPSSNLQFHPVRIKKKSVCMTYILTLFLGLFGAHHFYLGRPKFGTLYIFTAGLLGWGYVVDLVRVPWLVENANLELLHPELRGRKYLVDAYLLWLPPFGLLGFHHFYLGNMCNAFVYMVTAGALLMGWILDICLVPLLWMRKANVDYSHIIDALNNHTQGETTETWTTDCAVVTAPQPFITESSCQATIMLNPPPYSEVQHRDCSSPPSYAEVLAMDDLESYT